MCNLTIHHSTVPPMMRLTEVQSYLQTHSYDGWLLYGFRQQNPIATRSVGLPHAGSRRWFLWIPADGQPAWLVHAIETHMFVDVAPELQGEMLRYVSWQEMEAALPQLIGARPGQSLRILMEYSPRNAIPYTSTIDAGIKELVEEVTGARIESSADLVQQITAVLTPKQIASHRRAAAGCLAAKDAAFAFIGERLAAGRPVNEFEVQEFIESKFAEYGLATGMTPLCAVNRNAADPHYIPSAAHHSPIEIGDVVLIDLWSRTTDEPDDSFADITWVGYCGDRVPPQAQAIFDVVTAARDAAVASIQERLDAGQPAFGYAADDAARAVIVEAGYGMGILHRTGHSLGPTGHWIGANLDNLETRDQRPLIPRLMFTVEPGIYLPDLDFDESGRGKGLGLRSEINCLMHPDRVEITTLPLQQMILPVLA